MAKVIQEFSHILGADSLSVFPSQLMTGIATLFEVNKAARVVLHPSKPER